MIPQIYNTKASVQWELDPLIYSIVISPIKYFSFIVLLNLKAGEGSFSLFKLENQSKPPKHCYTVLSLVTASLRSLSRYLPRSRPQKAQTKHIPTTIWWETPFFHASSPFLPPPPPPSSSSPRHGACRHVRHSAPSFPPLIRHRYLSLRRFSALQILAFRPHLSRPRAVRGRRSSDAAAASGGSPHRAEGVPEGEEKSAAQEQRQGASTLRRDLHRRRFA